MKYDARACHFNMDTGCVELLLRDGKRVFFIEMKKKLAFPGWIC